VGQQGNLGLVSSTIVQPPVNGGSWVEQWSATICGKVVNVTMQFTPDGHGGTNFTASLPAGQAVAG
jgi:hypothetical protein